MSLSQARSCRLLLGADDDVGRWITSRVPHGEQWVDGGGTAIGFVSGEKIVAGAAYFRYNGASLEVAFASESPHWMSREGIRALFAYPFEQLRVKRLTAIPDASNHASRRLIEALKFTPEATLTQAAPDGDQVVYRMLRDECPWL